MLTLMVETVHRLIDRILGRDVDRMSEMKRLATVIHNHDSHKHTHDGEPDPLHKIHKADHAQQEEVIKWLHQKDELTEIDSLTLGWKETN